MEEMGWIRGVITIVTMATFLGICWWAYRPGNRRRFERDAQLAFDEGSGVSELDRSTDGSRLPGGSAYEEASNQGGGQA